MVQSMLWRGLGVVVVVQWLCQSKTLCITNRIHYLLFDVGKTKGHQLTQVDVIGLPFSNFKSNCNGMECRLH